MLCATCTHNRFGGLANFGTECLLHLNESHVRDVSDYTNQQAWMKRRPIKAYGICIPYGQCRFTWLSEVTVAIMRFWQYIKAPYG